MKSGQIRRWIPAMICLVIAVTVSVTGIVAARVSGAVSSFPAELPDDEEIYEAGDTVAVDTFAVAAADSLVNDVVIAFLELPDKYLAILPLDARMYMVNYLEEDSLVTVRNFYGGESRITEYKPGYMRVQLTKVSSLQLKQLPYRKGSLFMAIYTVASDKVAPDSELLFFDSAMQELKREKFFPTPDPGCFWNIPDDREEREKFKEKLAEVPFYAVEYFASPTDDNLTGRVSSISFLPEEQKRELMPQLRDSLSWSWDGKRYRPRFQK